MAPSTFADELGTIAAVALDESERLQQTEKQMLRAHLEEEWKELKKRAISAAKGGRTSYSSKFKTGGCNFKAFKPQREDMVAALPDELQAMYKINALSVGYASGPTLWPEFDVTITFATQAATSLGKLKREREAAAARDWANNDDASTKKVKVEPEVKVEKN